MTQTIGEQLKQARTQRGLTIDQASQATHIRQHYLEALENDQRAALPSAVQGRGFLRLYADLLNLPVSELLAAWDGRPPQPAPAAPTPVSEAADPTSDAVEGDLNPDSLQDDPQSPPSPKLQSGAAVYPPIVNQPAVTADKASGSQAHFEAIGRILQEQREALGLSLVEVERYTRLRQHYVRAMEEGRMDQLPSPVQGRGMLSNYAAFLNLDEDKLLLQFAEALQVRRVERLSQPETQALINNRRRPARQAPFWRRFLTLDLVFGVVVAAVILFFVIWTAARINNLRTTQAQPTPPAIADILLTPLVTPGGTGTPDALITNVAGEAAGSPENTPDPSQPPAIGETATQPPAAGNSTGAAAAETPLPPGVTATIPPMNKDPLQVYIVARQRAWLRVVADDKIKFQGRTVPGNAYAFSGSKRLELLTGDAAAFQVFYNQQDLGSLGAVGQVVGLVFVPDGMFTPTPAFTTTSTPTKPATPTQLPTATPQASPTITPYIPKP